MRPSRHFQHLMYALFIAAAAAAALAAQAPSNVTERVSVGDDEAQANQISGRRSGPTLNADGGVVAFDSLASNLVAGDTNGVDDVFVRDRVAGRTERISVSSAGDQGNGTSVQPSISNDGRVVAFHSGASNLVSDDTNGVTDVFVRDRLAGTTVRASVSSSGVQADRQSFSGAISADGRHVSFTTAANLTDVPTPPATFPVFPTPTVVVGTHRSGTAASLTADDNNYFEVNAQLQADGMSVAEWHGSFAGVPNDFQDLEVTYTGKNSLRATKTLSIWDWNTSTWFQMESAVVGTTETTFAFLTSLRQFVSDTGEVRIRLLVTGRSPRLFTSADLLRIIVFRQERIFQHIYVRDLDTGTTERVSVSSDGVEGDSNSFFSAISADGRFVAFTSLARNLVPGDTNLTTDVFVRDRLAGTTERVSISSGGSEANDQSFLPSISSDGRFVAFSSVASNLVAGDTNGVRDIFVHDRLTRTTERVSISDTELEANASSDGPGVRGGTSFGPKISADGRFVAFDSIATNLVAGDTNTCSPPGLAPFSTPGTCPDIFVRDRVAGTTIRFSVDSAGNQSNGASTDPGISADGLTVGFFSQASNLVAGDTNTCIVGLANHDDPGECPDIFARGPASTSPVVATRERPGF